MLLPQSTAPSISSRLYYGAPATNLSGTYTPQLLLRRDGKGPLKHTYFGQSFFPDALCRQVPWQVQVPFPSFLSIARIELIPVSYPFTQHVLYHSSRLLPSPVSSTQIFFYRLCDDTHTHLSIFAFNLSNFANQTISELALRILPILSLPFTSYLARYPRFTMQ